MAETASVAAAIAAAIAAGAAAISAGAAAFSYRYNKQVNKGSISVRSKSSQVEQTDIDRQVVSVKLELTNFGKEPVFLEEFEFLVFDLNLQECKTDTQEPMIDWLHEGQSFPYTNRFTIYANTQSGKFGKQAIVIRISFRRGTTSKTEYSKIYLINRGTDPDMPYMTKNMYEKIRPKIPQRFWRERE